MFKNQISHNKLKNNGIMCFKYAVRVVLNHGNKNGKHPETSRKNKKKLNCS